MNENELSTEAAIEFRAFPKMARLNREIIITEKIDGTNAQIFISESGVIQAGSRNQWITPAKDNYGFAGWVERNRTELLKLGPGRHFGEWWGNGIQRRYGMPVKVFSLFNVSRWNVDTDEGQCPACCRVVPVLYRGDFSETEIIRTLGRLAEKGSHAAPGFMDPEGIVIYHVAAGATFKVTLKDDEKPKSTCTA